MWAINSQKLSLLLQIPCKQNPSVKPPIEIEEYVNFKFKICILMLRANYKSIAFKMHLRTLNQAALYRV